MGLTAAPCLKKIKHHFTKIFKGKILTFLREDIPISGDNYKNEVGKLG